jgi:hypothetical protein
MFYFYYRKKRKRIGIPDDLFLSFKETEKLNK